VRYHGVGNPLVLVSGEAGAEQVVGVGGVAVGAGRADRGAAVPARGEHGSGAFEQDGSVAVEDLRGSGEVDGGGAAAGGLHLGPPGAVVGGAQPGAEQVDQTDVPIIKVACHGRRLPVPSSQRWQAVEVARRR
jgi:hypothetical protein